jgi:hypothetical protein
MNPWLSHLKKFQLEHPNMSYKECMVAAKASYKKKSGGSLLSQADVKKLSKAYNSRMHGAGFFDDMSGAINKITPVARQVHDFTKQNKLISQGLDYGSQIAPALPYGSIISPILTVGSKIAAKNGYGMKKQRKSKK